MTFIRAETQTAKHIQLLCYNIHADSFIIWCSHDCKKNKKKYFWEKVHNVKMNCILKTKVVNLRITVLPYRQDSVVIWIFASFLQVGGLASENVRWAEAVENFRKQEKTLCGDVLLIAAFISYLGYFTKHYRVQLMDNTWRPYLSQLKVCELVCTKLASLSLGFKIKNSRDLKQDLDSPKWHPLIGHFSLL